jgi:hypothetical protein
MLSSSAENSQILSHSFCRRLGGWNNSGVVKSDINPTTKGSAFGLIS